MFEQIIVAETHNGQTILVLGPERRTAIRSEVRRLKSARTFPVVYVATVVRRLKCKGEPERIPSAPIPPKQEDKPKAGKPKRKAGKKKASAKEPTGLTGMAARLLGK